MHPLAKVGILTGSAVFAKGMDTFIKDKLNKGGRDNSSVQMEGSEDILISKLENILNSVFTMEIGLIMVLYSFIVMYTVNNLIEE
jgi:hypothetical protein